MACWTSVRACAFCACGTESSRSSVKPSQPRVQAALTKRGLLIGIVRPERWIVRRGAIMTSVEHSLDVQWLEVQRPCDQLALRAGIRQRIAVEVHADIGSNAKRT